MSLTALAEASRLSKGFLSQLESGKSNASLASLQRLSHALDVPIALLISGSPGVLAPGLTSHKRVVALNPGTEPLATPMLALTGFQAGTHYVATIPFNFALSSTQSGPEALGVTALGVSLTGSVSVRQGTSVVNGTMGRVLSWNAGDDYSVENNGSGAAKILLFLPAGSPMPALVPLSAIDSRVEERRQYSTSAGGPMRLVAMRARRQAGQRR